MRMNLSALEIRILGCLMEKELTTPENYPLSLNALVSACNQKSNREPVMSLTEADAQRGLEALGARGLARLTTTGGRVAKYCHSVTDKLRLAPPARAVLAELMLRGPQTVGELRNRAERMAEIRDLAAVEEILAELRQVGPPLVTRLPRQAGRKEQRWTQLFAGMPELVEEEEAETDSGEPSLTPDPTAGGRGEHVERAAAARRSTASAQGDQRLAQLEAELGTLRTEIAALRQELEELIASFS